MNVRPNIPKRSPEQVAESAGVFGICSPSPYPTRSRPSENARRDSLFHHCLHRSNVVATTRGWES